MELVTITHIKDEIRVLVLKQCRLSPLLWVLFLKDFSILYEVHNMGVLDIS
jgi:hypothetical protein